MSWNIPLDELRELEKQDGIKDIQGRLDYEAYRKEKMNLIMQPHLIELSDKLQRFFKQEKQDETT